MPKAGKSASLLADKHLEEIGKTYTHPPLFISHKKPIDVFMSIRMLKCNQISGFGT